MKLYSNYINTGRRPFPQQQEYYVKFTTTPLPEAAEVKLTQIPVTGIWVEVPAEAGKRTFARVHGGQISLAIFARHELIETSICGRRIWGTTHPGTDIEQEYEWCPGDLIVTE